MKAVIFDTETTGLLLPATAPLEKQPKIIELGIVVVQDGAIVDQHNWMIYPGEAISEEITKITGITNDDLRDKPLFSAVLPEIIPVFADSDFGFAHNAPFDVGMLTNELKRAAHEDFPWPKQTICTAQEFTPMLGRRPRLIQLYEHVLGKPLAQTHRALDDAMAVYEVLAHEKFFEQLVE